MRGPTDTSTSADTIAPAPEPATRGKTPISLDGCRTKADVELAHALLAKAKGLPPTREDRVRRLRSALLAGAYDEDGVLDTALDRLLEELPAKET